MNALRKHIDRTTSILLVVLAICGLIPATIAYTLQQMAANVSQKEVVTLYSPREGKFVTMVTWEQQTTDPSLTYARLWRVGVDDNETTSVISSRAVEMRVGGSSVFDQASGSACYLLEQGSQTSHWDQPRRLVWLGCVR